MTKIAVIDNIDVDKIAVVSLDTIINKQTWVSPGQDELTSPPPPSHGPLGQRIVKQRHPDSKKCHRNVTG